MAVLRYLTLVWPGLPWLWLRGSRTGLVLALAFAVTVDVAMLTTFIWPELVGLEFTTALWTATAAIWLGATASAAAALPRPLPRVRAEAADGLFVQARDAYLARDWVAAQAHLEELLALAPTDGEAQLLWGTLLRRLGRHTEAREALAQLSRSDSGGRWRAAIARELALLDEATSDSAAGPSILPLEKGPAGPARSARRGAAA
ncbi:MAG: tetratricopeptide repeat protein [Planctomycetia bacterium]